jgi:RHS repeat-associated protein
MPWGETWYTNGYQPSDYLYTGQREESGIGLYYYNARWYDASLGRFIQADIYNSGSPINFDRYLYVNGNPINGIDPSGHLCQEYDLNGHNITTCNPNTETFPIIPSAITLGSPFDSSNYWSINRTGIDAAEYWMSNYYELLLPGTFKVSERLRSYLEQKEGIAYEMYDNDGSAKGNCTDAIGHCVHHGKCIKNGGNSDLYSDDEADFIDWLSQEKIDYWYVYDINHVEMAMNKNITVPLTQNQVDAIASLVFNIGPDNLFGTVAPSRLLETLNKQNYYIVPVVIRGLTPSLKPRRNSDANIFEFGDYSGG